MSRVAFEMEGWILILHTNIMNPKSLSPTSSKKLFFKFIFIFTLFIERFFQKSVRCPFSDILFLRITYASMFRPIYFLNTLLTIHRKITPTF
jgi:hypothetical protein